MSTKLVIFIWTELTPALSIAVALIVSPFAIVGRVAGGVTLETVCPLSFTEEIHGALFESATVALTVVGCEELFGLLGSVATKVIL